MGGNVLSRNNNSYKKLELQCKKLGLETRRAIVQEKEVAIVCGEVVVRLSNKFWYDLHPDQENLHASKNSGGMMLESRLEQLSREIETRRSLAKSPVRIMRHTKSDLRAVDFAKRAMARWKTNFT